MPVGAAGMAGNVCHARMMGCNRIVRMRYVCVVSLLCVCVCAICVVVVWFFVFFAG